MATNGASMTDEKRRKIQQAKEDYEEQSAALSQMLAANEEKYNVMRTMMDPQWMQKVAKENRESRAVGTELELDEQMQTLTAEYDRNTRLQDASQRVEHSSTYTTNMQAAISDVNAQQLSDLNADLMTSKRMSALNTEEAVRLEDNTKYLRSFVVVMCVAILIMVLCTTGVIRLPIACMLLGVLALGLIIALIVHAVSNANRYRMLFPEREWPLHIDPAKDDDEDCACPAPSKKKTT